MANQMTNKTLEEKAKAVLALAYDGLHHLPYGHRINYGNNSVAANVPICQLTTFDGDILTRLIIACHDECVRLELAQSGPGLIKLVFHDRSRLGDTYHRHPTIEEAIRSIRNQ
jgi:hypothetical protein